MLTVADSAMPWAWRLRCAVADSWEVLKAKATGERVRCRHVAGMLARSAWLGASSDPALSSTETSLASTRDMDTGVIAVDSQSARATRQGGWHIDDAFVQGCGHTWQPDKSQQTQYCGKQFL